MVRPFHKIEAESDIPLFVFGDHASNFIPPELSDLGLAGEDLTRHIAWDIGTERVVRDLCAHFGCGGQVAGISRLVVDVNREEDMACCVPGESDGTVIPGNQNLSPQERSARIEAYHTPYHAALGTALEALDDPLVISIHSFTPQTRMGDIRLVDIGLLVKHDEPTAFALREMFMRLGENFTIAINEPYSAHILNHTIDSQVASRGLRHLAIEINQRHIMDDVGASRIAAILAGRLEPIVNQTFRSIEGDIAC